MWNFDSNSSCKIFEHDHWGFADAFDCFKDEWERNEYCRDESADDYTRQPSDTFYAPHRDFPLLGSSYPFS